MKSSEWESILNMIMWYFPWSQRWNYIYFIDLTLYVLNYFEEISKVYKKNIGVFYNFDYEMMRFV